MRYAQYRRTSKEFGEEINMTSSFKTEWKSNHPIYERISPETKNFLFKHDEILRWLDDSFKLFKQFENDRNFQDYSFVITPAFKALEKWLLMIAPYLGVPDDLVKRAENTGKLGIFLNDDDLENFIDNVLNRLGKSEEKRKSIRTYLQSLNQTLKNFRHNPAHCGNIIENPLMAETMLHSILSNINEITSMLIEEKIITN